MNDDDIQLIKLQEEFSILIWAVYIALTMLLLLAAATLWEIMAKAGAPQEYRVVSHGTMEIREILGASWESGWE